MSIKLIVFITLLIHGVGHFQGVAAGFGVKINNLIARESWFLKELGETMNHRLCLILFLITGLLGILTALSFKGILLNESNWHTLAMLTAFFSTACLVLFPNGFAMFFNKAGAIAVNLLIYYSVFINKNWLSMMIED